jgi:hypothetical protein
MCVSTARIWSCIALLAQCLLSVLRAVEDVLSLLGQYPLTGEGAVLTRHAVASVYTVGAHAFALLQQTIITRCSRARCCELTVCRLPAHMRSDATSCVGNRRAYRGVSIPAQCVNRQAMPCLGRAQPTYPHLMR